jgi:hypothetical protein
MTQMAKRKKPTKRFEQTETDVTLALDFARAHVNGTRNVIEYPALHRYFLHAARNRDLFLAEQKRKSPPPFHEIRSRAHLELWYACLITVLEGSKKEKINHPPVTEMARDRRKIDRLRKCRNAVFHYSRDYDDTRFVAVSEDADFVKWAHKLHNAISAFSLRGG